MHPPLFNPSLTSGKGSVEAHDVVKYANLDRMVSAPPFCHHNLQVPVRGTHPALRSKSSFWEASRIRLISKDRRMGNGSGHGRWRRVQNRAIEQVF